MEKLDINDTEKWGAFVERLIHRTNADKVTWSSDDGVTYRREALGPVFTASLDRDRSVAVYRHEYRQYTDEDTYHNTDDVKIEIVDDQGVPLWKLPTVPGRFQLIDMIEYKNANADNLLDYFMGDDWESPEG